MEKYVSSKPVFAMVGFVKEPVKLLSFINKLVIKTPRIAPVEEMPTRPKLSASPALLYFFKAETPAAKANIKGTVIAPVVAPEASNAMAKNSGVENKHMIKIKPYAAVNTYLRGTFLVYVSYQ